MKQFFFSFWNWIKTLPMLVPIVLVVSPVFIVIAKLTWMYWTFLVKLIW